MGKQHSIKNVNVKLDDLTGDTRIVADSVLEAARVSGISDDTACAVAVRAVLILGSQAGGMNIYIHSTKELVRNDRNRMILKKFTGNNHRELAREFELSESHIRAIIRNATIAKSVFELLSE